MNNEIPNYGNKYNNNTNGNIGVYLKNKNQIKAAMNDLKYEVARDMGYDKIKISDGKNLTSREVGLYAGPVGGVIVKDLIANAEKMLMEKNNNR